jgi:hypothetical protein
MTKLVLFPLLCSFVACSHHREKAELEKTLVNLQCEDALRKDPFRDFTDASVEVTEHLGKKALAYSYIAGNYTAEVLWDVSAGVVLFVGLCAPVMAVAAAAQGPVHGNWTCIPAGKTGKALFAPPLGRKSVQKTHNWRCPNYEPLLNTLQKVILCHQKKDTPDTLDKALQTLANLESSSSFYDCLSDLQKLSLQDHRLNLQKRLAELGGSPKSL